MQDAFVVALEVWPRRGVPRNPGAWITTTARNKAIDRIRRARRLTARRPDHQRLRAIRAGAERTVAMRVRRDASDSTSSAACRRSRA